MNEILIKLLSVLLFGVAATIVHRAKRGTKGLTRDIVSTTSTFLFWGTVAGVILVVLKTFGLNTGVSWQKWIACEVLYFVCVYFVSRDRLAIPLGTIALGLTIVLIGYPVFTLFEEPVMGILISINFFLQISSRRNGEIALFTTIPEILNLSSAAK